MQQVALLGASLANNCTLRPTIDESLYWRPIDLSVDVKHSNVAEELRVIFHGLFVLCIDCLLSNLFFNKLLRFHIVWISISKFYLALLFSFLFRHLLLQPVRDNLFDLGILTGLKGLEQITVTILQSSLEMLVCKEHFL